MSADVVIAHYRPAKPGNTARGGPESLGLMLLGAWCGSPAILGAYERNSIVVDEADFCRTVECAPGQLDDYLLSHWREHSIHAIMDGTEHVEENNLSLVKQYDGYFTVRLFSPREPDSAVVRRLRAESVRPQPM